MDIPDQLSCIILSAGNSGRMGMHKALLPFGKQNLTFLEKITESYSSAGIHQVIVVVNSSLYKTLNSVTLAFPDKVKLVVNRYPEKGRFFSLQTGLYFVGAGSYVFIQNADNPFVEPDVLRNMIEKREEAAVVVPVFSGKAGHPVLLNPIVCESIKTSKSPDCRLDFFLRDFSSCAVESDNNRILVNINTPSDYKREFETGISGPEFSQKIATKL